jgi:hypothetical protein
MVTTTTAVTSIASKNWWILLDSGSDGNLIFVNKDKPMLLAYSKRLVPQSWDVPN